MKKLLKKEIKFYMGRIKKRRHFSTTIRMLKVLYKIEDALNKTEAHLIRLRRINEK